VPTFTLIAGPNGSGKSTITRRVNFEGRDLLLDPDAIARRLSPFNPLLAAMSAGREVIERTAEYFEQGVSFAVETTLSSRSRVDLIREAKSRGFETHLLFIALDNPERCISRVRNRAARGGHLVPEADVRRRYARSIANAALGLRWADYAEFYDNSEDGHLLTLIAKGGAIVRQADELPEWVKTVIAPSHPDLSEVN
jgi:predicted ABC-type ATPase